jgi:hypothetical protein
MSSVPALVPRDATAWQWPADVLDFAARHQVDRYLHPLLEAIRQLFPTAQSLKVFLEGDPELHDVWQIVFEVEVPQADVPDYIKARHSWSNELFRICPAPLVCNFGLDLNRIP